MFELIKYGERLLDMLNKAGDWLMRTPGDFHFHFENFGSFSIPNPFGSVAEMIFGGGIVTILMLKLVKVIWDALPVA